MDQQKTGLFLKKLRHEKSVTQMELAERLGVSNRSVSRWENGTTMPDFDLLIEHAQYYDVEVEELLDGERRTKYHKNPGSKNPAGTKIGKYKKCSRYRNEQTDGSSMIIPDKGRFNPGLCQNRILQRMPVCVAMYFPLAILPELCQIKLRHIKPLCSIRL